MFATFCEFFSRAARTTAVSSAAHVFSPGILPITPVQLKHFPEF
jgi:hypothetical protein